MTGSNIINFNKMPRQKMTVHDKKVDAKQLGQTRINSPFESGIIIICITEDYKLYSARVFT